MTGGHLTPRRLWAALLTGALIVAVTVGVWWWRHSRMLPQMRADHLLLDSPALRLPSRPEGMVVLAQPGGWARWLGRNRQRRVLLDPRFWSSLRGGSAASGSRGALPAEARALLLDQFRRGLTVAWWRDGWLVQGSVPGSNAARRLADLLPQSLAGRWSFRDGVLRIVSRAWLLEGRAWAVAPAIDPGRRLACWLWVDGAEWPGHWEDGRLVLEHGAPGRVELPGCRGALLARLEDGRSLLDMVAARLPAGKSLSGLGERLDGLLARPVVVWLRRLDGGSALPRPRMALDLALLEHESGEQVAASLQEVLCPVGCTTEEIGLSNGHRARRWRSALGNWWVVVLPGDAVVAAAGQGQLETLLGARGAWPNGDWAVVGADAAAASLEALASARLLAVFGIVPPQRLDLLRRLAVPLRGLTAVTWQRSRGGARVEVVPAPAG